ncbi:unnamed protein product [Hyaloperonospora brassicae]|uniref:Uncharacterized protein n=1 Tax=Hyaloperonospora brassicae TaxID=162125 RepID=A0AAV0TX86_HYABA|nr:unnamed protein product [Hyaloperonospora brassicae]
MREKWEAAQANLRAQLEKDDNYVHFLESVEKELARKLRFARRSRSGTLLDNIAFDRFVEATAQLKYLHTFYQGKLKLIVDPIDDENACSFDGKCDVLVETLEDMLSILRIVYGQLFSRRDATNTALQIAFEKGKNEWDGELLEKYLQSQFLTVDELVARPLNRFDELIQFVKALSVTFSKAKENDIARNGCNAGNTKGY